MRFTQVQAQAFGRFEDFDSGSTLLPDLNVVVGPNEAGKTTFFHLLYSIIFGMYPASKDQHPYAPWSGRDLDIAAGLQLDDGEKWAVCRKLAGSPTARLTRNEEVENLRNQTLSCARHVTREVFRQVFALTLTEIASLESRAWSEVQDRLIGGLGARDLVPARSVADALEEEARRLWRPDRRGKQEIRILQERIHKAKAARRAALDADRLLRESIQYLERIREERKAVRLEAEKHGLLIERITTLLPARVRLEQAARLDEEAGPPGGLNGLPADPAMERDHLLEEVGALGDRLREARTLTEKALEQAQSFSADHQTSLAARQGILEIGGAVAAAEPVRARLRVLEQEIQGVQRRIESTTHEAFERTLTAQEEATVRRLAMRDLHDRVRDAEAARNRMRDHSMRANLGGTLLEASPGTLALGLGATLAAATLLFWPAATPPVRALGGAVALAASMLLARWGTLRQAAKHQSASGIGSGSDAEATLAQAKETSAALGDFLSGLPVRLDDLTEAGPELVAALTRLHELWEDLETRTQERNRANETLDETDDRLAALGKRLELELPQDGAAAIHVLQTTLREAERAEATSKGARTELDRLARDEAEIEAKLGTRTETLGSLEGALQTLGDGDVETGIQAATRRRRAGETAAEIRADLEQTHTSLEELMARLAKLDDATAGDAGNGDDALAKARAAEKECSERIATLTGQITGLEHTCRDAAARTTADEIDGEIDALCTELQGLKREHDRKIVLAHAVREADGRFRDEHQPDIVRRASGYFAGITDDRYDGIIIGDTGELEVQRASDDRILPAGKLSTGTKEQLYLAMRLAAMSHLDHDRERLPVFIDEALVNWDTARRGRGFQLLRELSQTRQVFVMTCHESWAEELMDAGANRVDLA